MWYHCGFFAKGGRPPCVDSRAPLGTLLCHAAEHPSCRHRAGRRAEIQPGSGCSGPKDKATVPSGGVSLPHWHAGCCGYLRQSQEGAFAGSSFDSPFIRAPGSGKREMKEAAVQRGLWGSPPTRVTDSSHRVTSRADQTPQDSVYGPPHRVA